MSNYEMPPNLDSALKEAFKRQEAPDLFSDRVMARIPSERQGRSVPRWKREWLAIAASACVAVVGASAWQEHRRQVEGERAKRELIYALTVASESLQITKQMVTR